MKISRQLIRKPLTHSRSSQNNHYKGCNERLRRSLSLSLSLTPIYVMQTNSGERKGLIQLACRVSRRQSKARASASAYINVGAKFPRDYYRTYRRARAPVRRRLEKGVRTDCTHPHRRLRTLCVCGWVRAAAGARVMCAPRVPTLYALFRARSRCPLPFRRFAVLVTWILVIDWEGAIIYQRGARGGVE